MSDIGIFILSAVVYVAVEAATAETATTAMTETATTAAAGIDTRGERERRRPEGSEFLNRNSSG
jgi:hypothetical protein